MKRRSRRASVICGAALVALLVAVLVVGNWDITRNHIEAWVFQLTQETYTLTPVQGPRCGHQSQAKALLYHLADTSALPVITGGCEGSSKVIRLLDDVGPVDDVTRVTRFLRLNGWRVLEQRFPQRVYVVIRETQDPNGEILVIPSADKMKAEEAEALRRACG